MRKKAKKEKRQSFILIEEYVPDPVAILAALCMAWGFPKSEVERITAAYRAEL